MLASLVLLAGVLPVPWSVFSDVLEGAGIEVTWMELQPQLDPGPWFANPLLFGPRAVPARTRSLFLPEPGLAHLGKVQVWLRLAD